MDLVEAVDPRLGKRITQLANFLYIRSLIELNQLSKDAAAGIWFLIAPRRLEKAVAIWCDSIDERRQIRYTLPLLRGGPLKGSRTYTTQETVYPLRKKPMEAIIFSLITLQRSFKTLDRMPRSLVNNLRPLFQRVLRLTSVHSRSCEDRALVLRYCFFLAQSRKDIEFIIEEVGRGSPRSNYGVAYFTKVHEDLPIKTIIAILESLYEHPDQGYRKVRWFIADLVNQCRMSDFDEYRFSQRDLDLLLHAAGANVSYVNPSVKTTEVMSALFHLGADASGFRWTRGGTLTEIVSFTTEIEREIRRNGCCLKKVPTLRCLAARAVPAKKNKKKFKYRIITQDGKRFSLRYFIRIHAGM